MSLSEKVAYGIDPSTLLMMEFNDVTTLHDTVIKWYQYMIDNNMLDMMSMDKFQFCVNIPPSVDNNAKRSSSYSITSDGLIMSAIETTVAMRKSKLGRPLLSRHKNMYLDPEIGLIVITLDLFDEYLDTYHP